jgi:hypothetical protein
LGCTIRNLPHGSRDLDILCQVEVMHTSASRSFGNCDVAVEGQAGDHRVYGVGLQLFVQARGIGSVDPVAVKAG